MSFRPRPSLRISDYSYDLPAERIASRPLAERDRSRLLVYQCSTGEIDHRTFLELTQILPEASLLVVNQSRVVAARIKVKKPTGGAGEVLLTRPLSPSSDPAVALASRSSSDWECLIGGKNISVGMILLADAETLRLEVLSRNGTEGVVRLLWNTNETLSSVLEHVGHVPLPPYIKREDDAEDADRYQTVFARHEGSVAAPTAGLHFTERVLQGLQERGVQQACVTLHVGLGTFQPVEAEDARNHTMHSERIEVDRSELERIVGHLHGPAPFITVVGTTSMRTLESLYWFGCRLLHGDAMDSIQVDQWSAYDLAAEPAAEALQAVLEWMDGKGLKKAWGETQLMLAPGAHIGVVNALVTNFHQPGNTLLLLVAAIAGESGWRNMYAGALENDYRFLSYGDSSLIVR